MCQKECYWNHPKCSCETIMKEFNQKEEELVKFIFENEYILLESVHWNSWNYFGKPLLLFLITERLI